jgi:hypothetical protein
MLACLKTSRAAVHARALAVPDAEHAVELLALRVEVELLRAPHRGGAELLVDAGWKTMFCAARCFFALHSAWS